jgi:DNA-binding transcriptional LysR family regulator
MLNVHHLELFYYVARHKGITEASRHIPYGIQQPAISGQMSQLETAIGVPLFIRRPFSLTPPGKRLYEFILPFFSKLPNVLEDLHQATAAHLRLAASSLVLATHLPEIFRSLKSEFPGLRLTLKDATSVQALALLQRNEADLALTVIQRPLPTGCTAVELLRLPLVLLVKDKSPWKSAKQLLSLPPTELPQLVSLPEHENLTRAFHSSLGERGLVWEAHVEVDSLDLIERFVGADFGVGLSLAIPSRPPKVGLRQLPLTGFPPLVIGLLAMGTLNAVARRFAKLLLVRAKELQQNPTS